MAGLLNTLGFVMQPPNQLSNPIA